MSAGPSHRPALAGPAPASAGMPELLLAAYALRRSHHDDNGWCRGCRDQYGHLKPHPCTQARWAHAVIQQANAEPGIHEHA